MPIQVREDMGLQSLLCYVLECQCGFVDTVEALSNGKSDSDRCLCYFLIYALSIEHYVMPRASRIKNCIHGSRFYGWGTSEGDNYVYFLVTHYLTCPELSFWFALLATPQVVGTSCILKVSYLWVATISAVVVLMAFVSMGPTIATLIGDRLSSSDFACLGSRSVGFCFCEEERA